MRTILNVLCVVLSGFWLFRGYVLAGVLSECCARSIGGADLLPLDALHSTLVDTGSSSRRSGHVG
jgi:hypothetical protein